MKASSWVTTGVLVVLALIAGWFFGLDGRHAVVLVCGALAAGIANELLEAVDLPRSTPAPLPEPVRGLADLQALEFSLGSSQPGTRALLEVHAIASSVTAAWPGAPRSAALEAFLSQPQPPAATHRQIRDLLDELEQIPLRRAAGPAGNSQEIP